MQRALVATLLLQAALGSTVARAEPTPEDAERARALFLEARQILKDNPNNWSGACPKFKESARLVPRTSVLLNVGQCDEHDDKLASAWKDYKRALDLAPELSDAGQRETETKFAEQRLGILAPQRATLRIAVTGSQRPSITCDGEPISDREIDTAIPLDAGNHTLQVDLPGAPAQSVNVTLIDGQMTFTTLPVMPPSKDTPVNPPAPIAPASPRQWPWVVGGVGLGVANAGSFFLVAAINGQREITNNCGKQLAGYSPTDCEHLRTQNNVRQALAGLLGGAGGLAVVIAGVALATTPRRVDNPPRALPVNAWIGPHSAHFTIDGRF